MQLEVGKFYVNRTRKYLVPVLQTFGEDFQKMWATVHKVAVGIGDAITLKSNVEYNQHLFILVDAQISADNFIIFRNWLRDQDFYETDYEFDDLYRGYMHMFVIQFPEQYLHVLESFKKSEYSKMFTKEELQLFFSHETKEIIKKVLTKDPSHKEVFAKQLTDEYGVSGLGPNDITDAYELDLPLEDSHEKFNAHLVKA